MRNLRLITGLVVVCVYTCINNVYATTQTPQALPGLLPINTAPELHFSPTSTALQTQPKPKPVTAQTLLSLPNAPAVPAKIPAKKTITPIALPPLVPTQFTRAKTAMQYKPSKETTTLTLQEAVLIALQHNPNVQIGFRERKIQRYDLLVAQQKFEPQFSVSGSLSYDRSDASTDGTRTDSTLRQANIGPAVTWTLPLGTQVAANYGYGPSRQIGDGSYRTSSNTWTVTITQPLLQNFGTAVNEVSLENAQTQQKIDSLQLKQTLAQTILTVSQDYYAVVQAKASYRIAKQSLARTQKAFDNRQALEKMGRVAAIDVDQAQLNLSQAQSQVTEAQQQFNTAHTNLLSVLGLPSNTVFTVVSHIDYVYKNYPLHDSIERALAHNINLHIDQLQLTQAQRSVLTADNQNRWQLNLIVSKTRNTANTDYSNTTLGNSNTVSSDSSAALDLNIPLNDVTLDQTKLQSAVSLDNSTDTFYSAREQLTATLTSAIENLKNQYQQIKANEEQCLLAQREYQAAEIKFTYGRMDAYDLAQQQLQLTTAQLNVVNSKIQYIEQQQQLENNLGTLLNTWNIHTEDSTDAT